MPSQLFWRAGCAVALAALNASAWCQEIGGVETFGGKGRLYSTGSNDHYLISRQSYATEDSSGYEGRLRIVKKYGGGAYEEILMDYTARCNAYDKMIYVSIRKAGIEDGESIDIKGQNKFPGQEKKAAYNLYWAACHGQYRKFR
jgi:hypothetical protein